MSQSTNKATLSEFIELYHSLPAVWNTSNPLYNNRSVKNDAYKKLIQKLQEFDPDANRMSVVKKINSLRTNFRKEIRKIKESKRNDGEQYKPTLWYFEKLRFLQEQDGTDDDSIKEETQSSDGGFSFDVEEDSDQSSIRSTPAAKKRAVTTTTPSTSSSYKKSIEKSNSREFKVMGMSYVEKLKRMDPIQCLYADKLINLVLFEGQLGNLKKDSSILLLGKQ